MKAALDKIHGQFQQNKPTAGESGSWRKQQKYFQEPEGEAPPLGAPCFAPLWFMVGHKVRLPPISAFGQPPYEGGNNRPLSAFSTSQSGQRR